MKRIPMSLLLQPQTYERAWPCRTIRSTDKEDLAILLYAAFRGTPDDEGEPFAAAVREIERTFTGDYGQLISACSFVISESEFLSSACLVSWYEPAGGPFVVFTMTRPECKGQGMARFLLKKSINALLKRADTQLTLIVTEGNLPAQRLYQSLGFEPLAE